jgi:hypothetical protein
MTAQVRKKNITERQMIHIRFNVYRFHDFVCLFACQVTSNQPTLTSLATTPIDE